MKKILISIFIILIFTYNVFLISGCNKSKTVSVSLNVATYNIKSSVMSEEKALNIMNQITENEIDLIGFQEFFINNTKYKDSFKSEYLNYFYFAGAMNQKIPCLLENYGVANTSHYEIIEENKFSLPYLEEFIYNKEYRILSRIVINVNGVNVAFYNTHLSFESKEDREPQIKFILEKMNSDPIPYIILTGDFNNSDFEEIKPFSDNYNLANNTNTVFETFPAEKFKSIDNIITSNNINVSEVKVIDSDYSDHKMLMAKMDFTAVINI